MTLAVLDTGPVGLSVAMTVKRLYLESAVLLKVDASEMMPVSGAIENLAARCRRE